MGRGSVASAEAWQLLVSSGFPRMPPSPAVLELTRPRPVPRGLLLYNIHHLSFFVHGRLSLCSWPQLPLLLPCPNLPWAFKQAGAGSWTCGLLPWTAVERGSAGRRSGACQKVSSPAVGSFICRRVIPPSACSCLIAEVSSVAWEFIDMTEQEEDLIDRMYRLVGDR